jgi:hypothetical protein
MKKLILTTSLIAFGAFMFTAQYGCKKSSSSNAVDSVSCSDANLLQAALSVTGGVLKSGTFPTSSTSGAPILSAFQSSAGLSAGHSLLLPFNYASGFGISKVLVMVQNATNGYIETSSYSSSGNTGTIVLSISIPGKVKYGSFTLRYIIIDNSGNVSNMISTDIVINAPVTCANASVSGSEGLTFTTIDMTGKSSGSMTLSYDTYSVPDRIDVYQGSKWLAGTGTNPNSPIPPQCNCSTPLPGFIGATGTLTFPYDANLSKDITVVVSGCLGGGTAWDWSTSCPL